MSNPPPLPKPTLDYGSLPPSKYAPCPQCGTSGASPVGFTWWGGVLGPKLFTHVRCPICRTCYNGKTGQSNNTNILIYTLVSAGIVFVILFILIGSRFLF